MAGSREIIIALQVPEGKDPARIREAWEGETVGKKKSEGGRHTGKVIRNWMLSYLFILILPILFGCVIYLYSMKTIREEAESIQYQAARHSKAGVETLLDNLTTMTASVMANASIRSVAEIPGEEYGTAQRLVLKEIQEMFVDYMVSNEAISNIFLYLPQAGYVISSQDVFFSYHDDMFLYWLKMNGDEFAAMVDGALFNSLHVVQENGKEQMLYTTCGDYRKSFEEQSVIVIVTLHPAKVKPLLKVEEMTTYLVDGKGNFFLAAQGEKGADPETAREVTEKMVPGEERFYRSGDDYFIRLPIRGGSLSLLHVISKQVFSRKLDNAVKLMVLYITACLFIGVALAGILSRRNYTPVGRILKLVQKTDFRSSEPEEFRAIQESLEKMISGYEKSRKMAGNWEFYSRSNRLFRLLNRTGQPAAFSDQEWEEIRSQLPGDRFLLLSFELEDVGNVFMEERDAFSEEARQLMFFVLQNIGEELLQGRYRNLSGDVSDHFVMLLNPDKQEDETVYSDLIRAAERMVDFLSEAYHMTVWANLSRIHTGLSGIGECNSEIREMQDYRDCVGTSRKVLRPEDFGSGEELCRLRIYQQEKKAGKMIRQHQYGAARSILEQMEEEEKRREEEYQKEKSRKEKALRRKNGGHVIEDVAGYIDSHYADKQLSAGMLSELFEMSISNLSQSFKRKMNAGVAEYISQIRLREAKELLKTGMTVKEAAEAVGYYNTRPLIRLFRDNEGVTPSEYRDMVLREEPK